MTVIERLRKESAARTLAMKVEKVVDKRIEDKRFGRISAAAWQTAYEKDCK